MYLLFLPSLGLTNCVLHVNHLKLIEECLNFCLERDNRYLISLILALRRIISSGHCQCVGMALFYSTDLYWMWLEIDTLEFCGFLIPHPSPTLQNEEVLANNHHKCHWDDHACKYISYGLCKHLLSRWLECIFICRSCQYVC